MHIFSHFAYLDAGTGSLIVQSIIGAAAGVVVFGRKLITNLTGKVRGLFARSSKENVDAK